VEDPGARHHGGTSGTYLALLAIVFRKGAGEKRKSWPHSPTRFGHLWFGRNGIFYDAKDAIGTRPLQRLWTNLTQHSPGIWALTRKCQADPDTDRQAGRHADAAANARLAQATAATREAADTGQAPCRSAEAKMDPGLTRHERRRGRRRRHDRWNP